MIEYALVHRVKYPDSSRFVSDSISAQKLPLLILVHDLGEDEQKLLDFADEFDDRFLIVSVRGPFTQSPTSYAWYRVSPFFDQQSFFVDDAETSRLRLVQFINEIVSTLEVNPNQVYLFGYGQGATICLSVLFTEPGIINGVAALSGEVLPEILHMRVSRNYLKRFPVFLAYGVHDQAFSIQNGRRTRDLVATFTENINYREYPIGHHLAAKSIRDASDWIARQLDKEKGSRFDEAKSRINLSHVQLRVRDLDRSIAFYKKYLRLRVTERVGKAFAFLSGSYQHHNLALQSVGPEALDVPPESVGITSIAFESTDRVFFAEIYQNLIDSNMPVRTMDHMISWSIYFFDPDGIEIEVYLDTRDLPGKSDLWRGRDSTLSADEILSLLKNEQVSLKENRGKEQIQ